MQRVDAPPCSGRVDGLLQPRQSPLPGSLGTCRAVAAAVTTTFQVPVPDACTRPCTSLLHAPPGCPPCTSPLLTHTTSTHLCFQAAPQAARCSLTAGRSRTAASARLWSPRCCRLRYPATPTCSERTRPSGSRQMRSAASNCSKDWATRCALLCPPLMGFFL